jgi:soluble lytic murein transglycosylase-like protein
VIQLAVLGTLTLLATLIPPAPSYASSLYRRVDEEGVTHFTNAPTDPRFQRVGSLSGTAQGWLRLPDAVRSRYSHEIREIAGRHGVDADLVEAVIRAESAFNPRAVSNKGAQGLMQLMPRTASALGVRNAFDPYQNIDGGVRHLRYLLDRYPGNVSLALAAYNAGEKAVDYYRGIPPYAETTQYVQRILGQSPSTGSRSSGTAIYRYIERDGTVTITNVPRGRSVSLLR